MTNLTEAKYSLLTIAILAIYCIFIIYNIFLLPPWYDEVTSLLHVSGNALPDWKTGLQPALVHKAQFQGTTSFQHILDSSIKTDVHPPVYFFVTLAWAKLFGNEIEYIRLISLLAISVSALLLYSTAEMYKSRSGVIAVLLFLSFPMTTWAAVNARDYALSLVFLMCVFFFFTKALVVDDASEKHEKKIGYYIIAACLFISISFLTHYFTILVAAFVYLLLVINFYKTHLGSLITGGALIIIGAVLALPILAVHFGARPGQYSGFVSFPYEMKATLQSVVSIFAEVPDSFYLLILYGVFYSLILLSVLILVYKDFKNKKYLGFFYVLLSFLFVFCLYFLLYFTDKSPADAQLSRYTIFITPLLAIFIAGLLLRLFDVNKVIGLSAGLIWFLFAISTWVDTINNAAPWRIYSRFNEISEYMEDANNSNTLVLISKDHGHGRGTPGTWIYTLDGRQPVIIYKDDIDMYRKEVFAADVVIIARDKTTRLNEKLSMLQSDLEESGYILVNKNYNSKVWKRE